MSHTDTASRTSASSRPANKTQKKQGKKRAIRTQRAKEKIGRPGQSTSKRPFITTRTRAPALYYSVRDNLRKERVKITINSNLIVLGASTIAFLAFLHTLLELLCFYYTQYSVKATPLHSHTQTHYCCTLLLHLNHSLYYTHYSNSSVFTFLSHSPPLLLSLGRSNSTRPTFLLH